MASELATPKRDVKKSVALNAVLRPMRSEPESKKLQVCPSHKIISNVQVPQPTAPNIMPANIVEDKSPIRLSGTRRNYGQVEGRLSRHGHRGAEKTHMQIDVARGEG